MNTAFAYDFSGVRVHANNQSAELTHRMRANAFAYGNDLFFDTGRYAPTSGSGRRLIAHELAHTVQQSSGEHAVQGDFKFEDGTEDDRLTVVDVKTGNESRSETVYNMFKKGAFKYLGLELTGDSTSFSSSKVSSTQTKKIKEEFQKHYSMPIKMVLTKGEGDEFRDEEVEIDARQAIRIWESVRDDLKGKVDSFWNKIVLRAPSAGEDASNPGIAAVSSLGESSAGENDIKGSASDWKNMAVRSDAMVSFDGFWILLHEIQHLRSPLKGSDASGLIYPGVIRDAGRPAYGGKIPSVGKRAHWHRKIVDHEETLTLRGEAASRLNILRQGFGIPVRTSYTDGNGVIFFEQASSSQDEVNPDPPWKEEFVGATTNDRGRPDLVGGTKPLMAKIPAEAEPWISMLMNRQRTLRVEGSGSGESAGKIDFWRSGGTILGNFMRSRDPGARAASFRVTEVSMVSIGKSINTIKCKIIWREGSIIGSGWFMGTEETINELVRRASGSRARDGGTFTGEWYDLAGNKGTWHFMFSLDELKES